MKSPNMIAPAPRRGRSSTHRPGFTAPISRSSASVLAVAELDRQLATLYA
jgi:hypothetical protein